MSEQENYNIPYLMERYNIGEIQECNILKINEYLQQGYILLDIVQYAGEGGADPSYVIGKPRPQYCEGYSSHCVIIDGFKVWVTSGRHESHVMQWQHETKTWACPLCIAALEVAHKRSWQIIDGRNHLIK